MRIHFDVVGVGHPLVLVHGWGTSARRNWVDTGWVDALSPVRQLVLVDVRGHGRSEAAASQPDYGYAAMGSDVLQVLDELSIDTADLFGYSMGAFIGVSLLGHHADRFSSMVLGGIGDETEASGAMCDVIATALRTADPADVRDPVGRAYRRFVDEDPGSDREALAMAALQMWPEGHPRVLGGPGLANVDVPVLLVDGAEDRPYVDTVGELAAAIPGAELVTIPGTDHLTVVADARFKQLVRQFLGR